MAPELHKLKNKYIRALQYLAVTGLSALFLISCATTSDYSESEKKSTSSYTFYDYRDGDKVQYKVYFNEDEISSLYIDGKKVPDNEINKHKNMIYDRLDIVSQGSVHRFRNNFHVDSDWLNEMMGDLKDNLKENKIHIHIDKDKLRKDIERLKDELKDIDVDIEFDKDQFKREMRDLKRQLNRMKHEDFQFDMEEFSRRMEEFSEKMKNQKFAMNHLKVNIPDIPEPPEIHIPEINIPDIKVDLSGLDESMKDLNKNMAELDKHMKKLDAFMDEWKKELVKDGIIKNEEEAFEMDVHKNGIKINDKEIPDSLFKKYKELYKKHFGEEFDPHLKFHFND